MPPLNVAPELSQAVTPEDPMTERKVRKRLQNRLNQRAHRSRLRDSEGVASKPSLPYQIDRWRLDDAESSGTTLYSLHLNDGTRGSKETDVKRKPDSLIPSSKNKLCTLDMERYGQRLEVTAISVKSNPLSLQALSLMPDHLLHLINYNAFRGFYVNKTVLVQSSRHMIQKSDGYEPVDIMKTFPAQTVIIPTGSNLPKCLAPTPLQREKLHSTWIDLLPFPRMRENLIAKEEQFDHWEILNDVIGDMLNELMLLKRKTDPGAQSFSEVMQADELDDDLTANRKGLIVWGEPYDPKSWGATPGFVAKWGWTVEGCEELIDSTNRWRQLRGEIPLFLKRETETILGE